MSAKMYGSWPLEPTSAPTSWGGGLQVLLQLLDEAVLGDAAGDVVGDLEQPVGAVAHGHAAAGPLEHLEVVVAVADGEDIRPSDVEPVAQELQPGRLRDALRR